MKVGVVFYIRCVAPTVFDILLVCNSEDILYFRVHVGGPYNIFALMKSTGDELLFLI